MTINRLNYRFIKYLLCIFINFFFLNPGMPTSVYSQVNPTTYTSFFGTQNTNTYSPGTFSYPVTNQGFFGNPTQIQYANYGQLPFNSFGNNALPFNNYGQTGIPSGGFWSTSMPYNTSSPMTSFYSGYPSTNMPFSNFNTMGTPFGGYGPTNSSYVNFGSMGMPYGGSATMGLTYGGLGTMGMPNSGFWQTSAPYSGLGSMGMPYGNFGTMGMPYGNLGTMGMPYGNLGTMGMPYGNFGTMGMPYGGLGTVSMPFGGFGTMGMPFGGFGTMGMRYGSSTSTSSNNTNRNTNQYYSAYDPTSLNQQQESDIEIPNMVGTYSGTLKKIMIDPNQLPIEEELCDVQMEITDQSNPVNIYSSATLHYLLQRTVYITGSITSFSLKNGLTSILPTWFINEISNIESMDLTGSSYLTFNSDNSFKDGFIKINFMKDLQQTQPTFLFHLDWTVKSLIAQGNTINGDVILRGPSGELETSLKLSLTKYTPST